MAVTKEEKDRILPLVEGRSCLLAGEMQAV